jgi:hypothetical protein
MSGLLDAVLNAGGGSAVQMLGGRFGLSPAVTRSALEALLPMVSGGLKNQAQAQGGIEGLLGSVLKPAYSQYGEDANELARPGTTAMGNEVLGAIFGNDRNVSRAVAAQAGQKTGLDIGMLKQMLPVVAMMAAGAISKNANAGGLGNLIGTAMGGGGGGGGGGLLGSVLGAAMGGSQAQNQAQAPAASGALGGLANMLDMNHDGNPLDDIIGMAGKFAR